MLFPTVEYAVFFVVVLAIAWPLAKRVTGRKIFLLAASYVFYGFWSWRYVPLLIAVSLFAGMVARLPMSVNGAALAVGVFVIEMLGPTGVAPFIYFQF